MNEAPAKLPSVIGVGPARTGTTWLHQVLLKHAGLPHRVKETLFFNRYYDKGIEWYERLFQTTPYVPLMEITPGYFSSAIARERIAYHIPDCKIICTFREPVGRIYSFYKLMRCYGWTRKEFEVAISGHEQLTEASRYAFHLEAWQRAFGADKVLVCIYDDLETDPQSYLDRVCDFIGIGRVKISSAPTTRRRVHTVECAPLHFHLARRAWRVRAWLNMHGAYRILNTFTHVGIWDFCFGRGERFGPLDAEIEARLRERFRPEVEALEVLIHRDLSAWKRKPGRTEQESRIRSSGAN